jgi:tetratricopeptide (TPR) repeat protein
VLRNGPTAFFSYSRDDSDFALRLAQDLKSAGANVWLDQLDIEAGQEWDRAIEHGLTQAPKMLLILSPSSVKSKNVRNEISFALDDHKTIIPLLYRDCVVPLQLRRVQYIDFRTDYPRALKGLLKTLGAEHEPEENVPGTSAEKATESEQERAWVEGESHPGIAETRSPQAADDPALRKSRGRIKALLPILAVSLGVGIAYYIATKPQRRLELARTRLADASSLYDQHNLVGALAAYREAIYLRPELSKAHAGVCFLLRLQGHLDGAIAECREAIRLGPDNAEAHYYLGGALTDKNDPDGAKAEYREVVTPNTPEGIAAFTDRDIAKMEKDYLTHRVIVLFWLERISIFEKGLDIDERPTLETLGPRLADIFKTRAEKTLWMNAASEVPFSKFEEVIMTARNAGVDRICLLPPVPPRPAA